MALQEGVRLEPVQSEGLAKAVVRENSSTEQLNSEALAGGGRQVAAFGAKALFDMSALRYERAGRRQS